MLFWTGRYDSNVPPARLFSDPWVKYLSCESESEREGKGKGKGEIEIEIGFAAPRKDSNPDQTPNAPPPVNHQSALLVLAIIFDRGLEKIRKLAQSRQGDMMLTLKSTELEHGEHGEHGKHGPGEHDELMIHSLSLSLSLYLLPRLLSEYRSRPPRLGTVLYVMSSPVLPMPCPAHATSCHVNGVVSKDDSLRLFDSSGVDERKKGHARCGAMYSARK